ncbi:unnamed protein product, partial [Medioppia subpectinata]
MNEDMSEESDDSYVKTKRRKSNKTQEVVTKPDSEEAMYHLLKMKKCFDVKTKRYICPISECHKSYDKRSSFSWHLKAYHSDRRFICESIGCGKEFRTKAHLKSHSVIHTSDKPFKCDYNDCQFVTKNRNRLSSHMKKHTTDSFRCPVNGCRKTFKCLLYLRQHSMRVHSIPSYKCRIDGCNAVFTAESQLIKHKTKVHNKTYAKDIKYIYRCDWPGCDWSGGNITRHKTIHTGELPFPCDWPECGKRFRVKTFLQQHMNVHNNVKPYACHWPGCTYSAAKDNQHFRTLSQTLDQLNDNCIKCESNFQLKSPSNDKQLNPRIDGIKELQTIHENEDNVRLKSGSNGRQLRKRKTQEVIQDMNDLNEDSDESYAEDMSEESNDSYVKTKRRKSNKTQEVVTKPDSEEAMYRLLRQNPSKMKKCFDTKTKRWICPINECHKSYPKRDTLSWHLKAYHSGRRFICESIGCGKEFKTTGHLKMHSVVHTSDKPFKCDYNDCQFFAKNKNRLLCHMKRHTTDSFRCPVNDCRKTFKCLSYLEGHSKRVHSIPSYECRIDGCNAVFTAESQLKKHKIKVHNRKYAKKVQPIKRCDWPGCDWSGPYIKQHKTIHTGELRFPCDWPECGKRFRLKTFLQQHMNVHNNVKPYVCHWPGCGYSYANLSEDMSEESDNSYVETKRRKSNKTQELVTQSDSEEAMPRLPRRPQINAKKCYDLTTKTYICPKNDCHKSCETITQFRSHLSRCRLEPIFKCKFKGCDKVFKDRSYFKIHLKNHTNQIRKRRKINKRLEVMAKLDSEEAITRLILQNPWKLTDCFDAETQTFICPVNECHKSYDNRKSLSGHFHAYHSGRQFICQSIGCGKEFKTKKLLQSHSIIHTSDKPFKCDYDGCEYVAKSSGLMSSHMKTHTTDNTSFSCETITQFRSHLSRCRLEPIFKCKFKGCDKVFKDRSYFKIHLKNHTNQIRKRRKINKRLEVMAKLDSEEAITRLILQNPWKLTDCFDAETQTFICPVNECHKSYDNRKSLSGHFHAYHSGRQFICESIGCGKEFKTQKLLKSHSIVHTSDKPFKCDYNETLIHRFSSPNYSSVYFCVCCLLCSKHTFQLLTDFCKFLAQPERYHMRTLHSPTPAQFKCSTDGCNEVFATGHRLLTHRVKVHGKPGLVYSCDWPGCEWTGAQLNRHKRSHTGEMPYPCLWPECGKRFARVESLTKHMNMHNNIKPYACHWPGCGHRYAGEDNQHFRTLSQTLDQLNEQKSTRVNDNYITIESDSRLKSPSKQLKRKRKPRKQEVIQTFNDINTHTDIRNEDLDQDIDESNDNIVDTETVKEEAVIKTDSNQSLYELLRQNKSERENYFDLMANVFICPINECQKNLRNDDNFYRHLCDVHTNRHFKCGFKGCDKAFKKLSTLKIHAITHENRRIRYRCEYKDCGKTFLNPWGLKRHAMTHITQSTSTPIAKKFKCHYNDCEWKFTTRGQLKAHLERHSSERPYRCDFIGCGKCFKTSTDLKNHSLLHQSGPTLRCDVDRCVDMFYTEYHRSLHHNRSTLKCGINGCNDVFTTEHFKRKHQTEVHNRAPLIHRKIIHRCDWPGCEWTGDHLKAHKRLHSGEKPYQCLWPDCGKRFRMNKNLSDHMNVHNNVKPYACHWPGCTYGATNSDVDIEDLDQDIDESNDNVVDTETVKEEAVIKTDSNQSLYELLRQN